MAFQALYRRYRPQRFAEVKGQEHVVTALRNAVRDETVGHAYLFSGPRGTGKTSTARILAKALNCEALDQGEPCGVCESCRAVEVGTSLAVTELDAASNNGVEAVRDLIQRAALGTTGRTKVYIVDEVHMLSNPASNALLKTLEEPPGHVVFVLATTDPHKVLPTIRSRTQHYDFRLLPASLLGEHLHQVASDAGLSVTDASIDRAVRKGDGSARDALSALDQIVAAGGAGDDDTSVDEIVEGLCDRDTARSLGGVALACGTGADPRSIASAVAAHLRDALLALMAPDLVSLPDAERERVADQARRLGAPALVRALEAVGDAVLLLPNAPDPRVTLEVALVKVTRPDADSSSSAILERLERLERSAREATTAAVDASSPLGGLSSSADAAGHTPSPSPFGSDGTGGEPFPPSPGPARPGAAAGSAPTAEGAAQGATASPPGTAAARAATQPGPGGTDGPAGGSGAPPTPPSSTGGGAEARQAIAAAKTRIDEQAKVPEVTSDKAALGSMTRGRGASTTRAAVPKATPPAATQGEAGGGSATIGPASASSSEREDAGGAADGPPVVSAQPTPPTPKPTPPPAQSPASPKRPPGATTLSDQDGSTGEVQSGGTTQGVGSARTGHASGGGTEPEPAATADEPGIEALSAAWTASILPRLTSVSKGRFSTGRFVEVAGGVAVLALPNSIMRDKCEEKRPELERALEAHFGRTIDVRLVVDAAAAPAVGDRRVIAPPEPDEHVDLDDLVDAPADHRSGIDRLTQAFPGAEVLDGG